MFKTVISSIVVASLALTPTIANANHRDRENWDRGHRHERGLSTGEAIALSLGAVIVGSIISDSRRNDRRYRRDYRGDYYYDYDNRPARCDRWVERVYDRQGRVHFVDRVRCR